MTNINPHIAARLKEKAEKIRKSHSAFWMGNDVEELTRKVEEGSIEYVERLRQTQRAVGNFVHIVTGEHIPVMFSSGQQSYTNGKAVVLSADLDPTKMDSLVGAGLHEGAHCLLSKQSLEFLPEMHKHFTGLVRGRDIIKHAKRLGIPIVNGSLTSDLGKEGDTVINHVQFVMNVLEDRRIDLWMYQNAAGYRPYYEALYDQYWHSPRIDRALQSPLYRQTAVQNYIMHVINMTNKNFDPKAMPGLEEIRKIASFAPKVLEARGDSDRGWKTWRTELAGTNSPIDANKLPHLFADAVRIVEVIYENSTTVQGPKESDGESEENQGSDLPNLDNGMPRPLTKEEIKAIKDALAQQKKFLNHDLNKQQISAETQAQLDQLVDTNANIVEVEGDFLPRNVKAKVVVYRDVTPAIVKKPTFPFRYNSGWRNAGGTNPSMIKALQNGQRLGAILANRIKVLQDESPLQFNHQQHGKLDKRRVSALGFGAVDVFGFTVVERKKPANLWLDVDFSGSMNGEKAEKAMTVAVALAYAASKTRNLNTTIAVRDGGSEAAQVAILYDSRRHRFETLRQILPHIGVGGGTPESLAFEAIKDEMIRMYGDERKYWINLSDGEPQHGFSYKGKYYSYGGEAAYKHTRRLMADFRDVGIQILSYYIGHTQQEHAGFRKMYGNDSRFIDVSSIGQIANTVNKLLMGEE